MCGQSAMCTSYGMDREGQRGLTWVATVRRYARAAQLWHPLMARTTSALVFWATLAALRGNVRSHRSIATTVRGRLAEGWCSELWGAFTATRLA